MSNEIAKNLVPTGSGNDVSVTKRLLLSSGVVLVIYGIAIALLTGSLDPGGMFEDETQVVLKPVADTTAGSEPAESVNTMEVSESGDSPDVASGRVTIADSSILSLNEPVEKLQTTDTTKSVSQKAPVDSIEDNVSSVLGSDKALVASPVDEKELVAANAPAVGTVASNDRLITDQPETQILTSAVDVAVENNTSLSLSGRVVDAEQAPLEGLQVYVRNINDLENHVAMTTTSRGGDFQLPGLKKSDYVVTTAYGDTISVFEFATSGAVDLHIVSGRPGEETLNAKAQTAQPEPNLEETAVDVNLAINSDYAVVGIVQSNSGQPLSGVEVSYDDSSSSVLTDLDGTYRLLISSDVIQATVMLQFLQDGIVQEVRTIPPAFWQQSDWFRQDVVLHER